MKKALLLSFVIFIIFSVLIIIYTLEISSNFTEFEGEDDEIEDGSIEKTSKILRQVRCEDLLNNLNPQQKIRHNPNTYFSMIKSIIN
jgi:hypothetical protein